MWGFLRVENEHLNIYGGVDGQGSDTDSQGQPLLLSVGEVTSSPAVSTAAMSSLGGSGDPINNSGGVSGGVGGILGWERSSGSFSRGNGLDRLPYSRMDMTSKHGAGIAAATSNNPVKAWCLTRVRGFCDYTGITAEDGEKGNALGVQWYM